MHWITGAIIGTVLVAVTSPLFVRSYAQRELRWQHGPHQPDEATDSVYVLPVGKSYRWRSEGYATTQIGPHGMPGKTTMNPSAKHAVALWGDSQAEGVAVNDTQKIFAIAESIGTPDLQVFPLAQSGDDASVWLKQTRWAEDALSIDVHVFLIVELSDLACAAESAGKSTPPRFALFAKYSPAFVIQAARNLMMDSEGNQLRSLRFSVGPQPSKKPTRPRLDQTPPNLSHPNDDWASVVNKVRDVTRLPVVVIYAPKIPLITGGQLSILDPEKKRFYALEQTCIEQGIRVVDLSDAFRQSAASGNYPHGFHNGVIGAGHLNAVGNQIVAQTLDETIKEITSRPASELIENPSKAQGDR